MERQSKPATAGLHAVVAGLFAIAALCCTVWIYWPGIAGPELLDDRSSLSVISDLKHKPELAFDYIFGDTSGVLGRPVSMATFVLEKMFLDEGITGSKKVNIVLHACNGALVIWLFWLLFRFLQVPGYRALSVLLGSAWLLHPLLVSTVLYAVQRMTMLAAFFMLLATIAYIYWRLALIAGKPGGWRFLPVPAFFVFGLFAKENAIVLVPALLLLEALWFQFAGPDGRIIRWLRMTSYALIGAGASLLLLFALLRWDALAARFSRRSFTLHERLLTQGRIVWHYIAQVLFPQPARMGLYHDDIVLSRSLFEPVSTAYALVGWLLLLIGCGVLLRWRSGRWIVLGISWFLVGHSVESTVLPLELYFEHRNYFPLLGLLLVVGSLFAIVVKRWPEPKAPLLACLGLCTVLLATVTGSQVQVWSNRSYLLLAQLNAHPDSARANIDMATEFARLGAIQPAYVYSRRAFESSNIAGGAHERAGDYEVRNLALSCIANAPLPPGLIEQLGRKDPQRPLSSVTTLLTMVRMLQDNKCPRFDRIGFADRLAEIYLVADFQRRASASMYSNLAVLENALQRYDNAYAYAERFLALSPGNTRGLLMKLHFASASGRKDATRDTIATLQAQQEQGKLTVAEQQTLALYLDK